MKQRCPKVEDLGHRVLDRRQGGVAILSGIVGAMITLLLAVAAFLATHTIPAMPRLRSGLIQVLGWRGYMISYSLLSLGAIGAVAWAYRQAPYVAVWDPDPRLNWAPVLAMPWACMAVVVGLVRPNPLSISFFRDTSDLVSRPEHQALGPFGITRHPVLWGFMTWALAHIVPNGDQASILVFGLLAVLSAAGMVGIDAKKRRMLGVQVWAQACRKAPLIPFGRAGWWRGWKAADRYTLLVGLAAYGLLIWLHPMVIGVSPLP